MVKEIAFTAYPGKDVAKLRQFYKDALGIAFDEVLSEEGVEKYAESKIANSYFSIMTHEWMDVTPGTASGIVFEVDDIEKTKSGLAAKGVSSEDIYDTPVCRVLSFKDPEGNKVTLHQSTRT
jgi:predicted enzyme related to lactoylglutathione lyase